MNYSSFLDKAALLSLVFCAVFTVLVGFWLVIPYHVMQVNSLRVIGTEVEVGDYLEYSLDYCKSKRFESLRAHVQFSFRDGVIYNLPMESGPLASGCATELSVLPVPVLPEGTYHLEMMRAYSVNPLRDIEVHAISNVFKISNRRRTEEMLRKQLPKVIPEVIPQIPQLR